MYNPGDIVEMVQPQCIDAYHYRRVLDSEVYAVGTRFVVISDNYEKTGEYNLRLLIDGKEIPQDGRSDRCAVSIRKENYRLVNTKRQKLLNLINSGGIK